MESWIELPLDIGKTPAYNRMALRLNSLGSLFYFSKYILNRDRLSPNLHGYMCKQFERENLALVLEIPRGHYKTTIGSVSAPIWWALPFNEDDEQYMRTLGYGDEWVRWMKIAHDQSTSTLIASEIIDNASKFGVQISDHYLSNARFRNLFPEIIPKKSDRWNLNSMMQNRPAGGSGEGTFDFYGVGKALQSNHYKRTVEDDLVGEKAVYSDLVMESTYEWHRKLPGVFIADPKDPDAMADQIVIGNRWSHRDLNTRIRENDSGEERRWEFHTHDAEGGCCLMHPEHGVPIFPEAFTMEKLAKIKQEEGSYNYACHYRNSPVDPEACRFRSSWLPRYTLAVNPGSDIEAITPIIHEVKDGKTLPDIKLNQLNRVTIFDPAHSEGSGRSRHALLTVGYIPRIGNDLARIYLLEAWAKKCSYEEMIEKAIGKTGLCMKWHCHHLYCETVAGQAGWYFLFQEKMKRLGMEAGFTVRVLKTDRTESGKQKRITGMEPVYENGLFYVPRQGRGVDEFLGEYEKYPNGHTLDLLDVAGYIPQTMTAVSYVGARRMMSDNRSRQQSIIEKVGICGY